jgi:hypothetical protein
MPVERSFRNAKSANVFDALPRQLKVFVIFCLASILPSVGGAYSTTVSQDVRELDRLTDWRISSKGLPEPIAETPEQVCQIEHLDNYTRRRVDHEVDKELTNAEATSRIADLDRRVLAFLQTRGWTRLAARTNNGGIPDLTRCYKKQQTVVQIYRTTGRCTMNSPCTAYDGFTVVFYLPRGQK